MEGPARGGAPPVTGAHAVRRRACALGGLRGWGDGGASLSGPTSGTGWGLSARSVYYVGVVALVRATARPAGQGQSLRRRSGSCDGIIGGGEEDRGDAVGGGLACVVRWQPSAASGLSS